ncbi:MAG: MBL fold metallo-hydrolase [Ilumatobacteraceae bacterium]
MRVTFHGVRGSTPCHGREIVRYGGNTSCVSVDVPGHKPIVFDLGTGLRYFGQSLSADEPLSATCLLSHLHWDHIQGLPFFKPLLKDGSDVHIYAPVQEGDLTVEQVFADTIKPPLFPIHFTMLPGMINFHEVWHDEFTIGDDIDVMARPIPHVGNTVGYRMTWQGTSITYMSDHQMPVDGAFNATAGAIELCRDADLLIHDAQYTPSEFADKSTWGHCTVEYAVWLAAECGVRKLALFHHDPAHHDDLMDVLAAAATDCGRKMGVEVFAAREGLVVAL